MKQHYDTAPAAIALAGILFITLAIYIPGLSGDFLFDDWSNLPLLARQGAINGLDKFVSYLLSGFAGPAGRPVALASFLLDANSWPAPPGPFKRTNLLFHLLNGALLTALIWQLANSFGAPRKQAAWIAVLGASLWLLHPLWVSTTLYVVQRMTMLATTFVLAGLVTYLYGRRLIFLNRLLPGYFWTTFSVVIFGLLAVLSKENGALLPLFMLVLERYGLNRDSSPFPPWWRTWKAVFLATPTILVLAYLAAALPALFEESAGFRDFTPGQRLLTQGRVVMDYLGLLILPRPYSSGLFTDNLIVSSGLFAPVTTFFGFTTILILITLAEKLRRSAPAIAVAIMFFLVGHIMESTWLQLELYFEHRNYLPAILLFLPIAYYLICTPRLELWSRTVIALILLCLLAGETLIRSNLWGKPFVQALSWAQQNPDSPRAQNHLASYWTRTGNHAEARRLLQASLNKHPNDLLTLAGLIGAECQLNDLSPQNLKRLSQVMETARVSYLVSRYQLDKTLSFLRSGGCDIIDSTVFEQLIDAGLKNPMTELIPQWPHMLYQQRAQLRLAQNRPNEAYADLMRAVLAVTTYDGILASAALLASNGHFELALRLLDNAQRPDESNANSDLSINKLRKLWLKHTNYYPYELQVLRNTIEHDLIRKSEKTALQIKN